MKVTRIVTAEGRSEVVAHALYGSGSGKLVGASVNEREVFVNVSIQAAAFDVVHNYTGRSAP